MGDEYHCRACHHTFPWYPSGGPAPCCPRCGSLNVEKNPWLLSQSGADGLTDEDHYLAGLSV